MEAKTTSSGAWPFPVDSVRTVILRDGRIINLAPGDSIASSPATSMPSNSPPDTAGGFTRPRGESFNSILSSSLSQDSTRDITDRISSYTFDSSLRHDSNIGQASLSNHGYQFHTNSHLHRPGTESDATQDAFNAYDMQLNELEDLPTEPFPVIQDDVVRDATGGDEIFDLQDVTTEDLSIDSFNRAADVVQPLQPNACGQYLGHGIGQPMPLLSTGPIDITTPVPVPSTGTSPGSHVNHARQAFASSPLSRSAQRHVPALRSPDTNTSLDEFYRVHRRRPGRVKGTRLTEEARTKAKFQRYLGNCDRCKAGKRPCDASTPCGPCRRQDAECHRSMMTSLINNILSDLRWAPYPRELSQWFPEGYTLGEERAFAFHFAAGRPIYHYVVRVQPANPARLQHTHVVHTHTQQLGAHPATSYTTRAESVLPVSFTHEHALQRLIDEHLDHLVNDKFLELDLSVSRFVIRDKIHTLYRHYRETNARFASLLKNAMKLLVLVHLGDTSINPNDGVVKHIAETSPASYNLSPPTILSPCILRAQLGKLQPILARTYLRTVLSTLFELLGSRARDNHHVVLATYVLVMATLESIMYHGARPAFHEKIGDAPARAAQAAQRGGLAFAHGREWSEWLLKLYRTCFENCHRKLVKSMGRVDEEGREFAGGFEDADADGELSGDYHGDGDDGMGGISTTSGTNGSARLAPRGKTVPTQFLAQLSDAITKANDYLERKKGALEDVEDVSGVFDKLLAKLLLLN